MGYVRLLLAATAEERPRGGGIEMMILYLVPLFLVFYFLFIRPQRKRDQERREMLSRLKKGDKVVTAGGIHGEIVELRERDVVLAVDKRKGIELRFQRSAIASVVGSKAPVDGGTGEKNEGEKAG
jgi:preprotein translocase subunit YajC